jgi:hypothetical protein
VECCGACSDPGFLFPRLTTSDFVPTQNFLSTGNAIYPNYNPSDSFNEEEELPILEELGINLTHIRKKTLSVLNPLGKLDEESLKDNDLAGPLFFALLLGMFLLLSGKLHFGYIYGLGVVGSISMYLILNLMSDVGIDIWRTISILGYCLLPMVFLSVLPLAMNLHSMFGVLLTALAILWCTNSASVMFITVLSMVEQRLLVAYPLALFYTCFALLTIF